MAGLRRKTGGPLLTLKKEEEVWIIGDSIISRARDRAEEMGRLNLDTTYSMIWTGHDGRKWRNLLPLLEYMKLCGTEPAMIIIHLGGDDVNDSKAGTLNKRLAHYVGSFSSTFPSTTFVLSDILPKRKWKCQDDEQLLYSMVAIERKRKRANRILHQVMFQSIQLGRFSAHAIDYRDTEHFLPDGAQLSEKGNDIFINALSEAVKLFSSETDERSYSHKLHIESVNNAKSNSPSDHNDQEIWIIGDSTVSGARDRAQELGRLNLDTTFSIIWMGHEGRVWRDFAPLIQYMKLCGTEPAMIIVHIGGNDMETVPVNTVRFHMQRDIISVISMFPTTKFVWSDILYRLKPTHGQDIQCIPKLEKKRKRIHTVIRKLVCESDRGSFIGHTVYEKNVDLFLSDGVSLSEKGYDVFIDSLSEAIKLFSTKPNAKAYFYKK